MANPTTQCRLCKAPVEMLGSWLCDSCWEADRHGALRPAAIKALEWSEPSPDSDSDFGLVESWFIGFFGISFGDSPYDAHALISEGRRAFRIDGSKTSSIVLIATIGEDADGGDKCVRVEVIRV